MQESHGKSAILGLQHLLAMYAGAVAVPLLIGQGLGFSTKEMTYLISIDIFMCGVATLLQLTVTKYTGIGLPVVLGCAVQAVAPLILIGSKNGVGAMYGSIIAAGVIIVLISGFFSKIKRFLPTIVTGSVIMVIGLTLIPISITKLGGGDTGSKSFGNPQNIMLGLLTVALIVIIQIWGRGFFKSISVLLGLLIATIVAYFLGDVSFSAVSDASWFHFPQFFYFGKPTFDVSSIVLMTIISLISLVESTGVYFALGDLTGKKITESELKKGYRAEGLAVILGGLFNTFPYTGFSQNVGLVQLSGIKSKRPVYYSAFLLIVLGLLPKIGAFAQVIPESVLGGGMLVMFGMVAVQGLKMLSTTDMKDEKNLLIMVLSIGLGLGFNSVPNLFEQFPEIIQMFTGNGIVITSIVAILLNIIFNEISPKVALIRKQAASR
ncbi:nucleobase:cation symporter-2 family protein [Vagococcus vulneris]|uniref:Uric acid permease PucJ n=1 Tax=Vagococcus vulneris TaxID=1977869 RepID=A0A429ZXX2_9ENTE|nr:nucleobase:cation symporter-2 family protein [Vagococcus vulneris]RST98760.1 Uric acid permease PucJ [Vagococcus vulneris]